MQEALVAARQGRPGRRGGMTPTQWLITVGVALVIFGLVAVILKMIRKWVSVCMRCCGVSPVASQTFLAALSMLS